MANKLSKAVNYIYKLPRSWHTFLLSKLFCSQVKFAKTCKVKVHDINEDGVVMSLANIKRVQNHIGGIHAMAAGLLAESTTGIAFGIHLPDNKIPLLKKQSIAYKRRMQGALKAHAKLPQDIITRMHNEEKGDVIVPVTVTG